MSEDDLKEIFTEYGQIYELLVLRDKATGNHKGMLCRHASSRSSSPLTMSV